MFGLHQAAVGGVEIHPAEGWAKHRDPGVGRIGADHPRLAGRRMGEDVAADIARRQAQAAQAANHQLGKVLAHATAAFEHLFQRGGYICGAVIELELVEDPLSQCQCRL